MSSVKKFGIFLKQFVAIGPIAFGDSSAPTGRIGLPNTLFPQLPLLGPGPLILPGLQPVRLALELVVGVEPVELERPVVEGGADRAAGLRAVLAVVEAAARGDRLDVLERGRYALGIDDPELAQAGRVDQQPVGQADELPARRRVPSSRVVSDTQFSIDEWRVVT